MNVPTNGWSSYEKYVIDKLEEHDEKFKDIHGALVRLIDNSSTLKLDLIKTIKMHADTCRIVEEFPRISKELESIKISISGISINDAQTRENTKDIGIIKTGVAVLDIKAGIWGMLGGIVSIVFILVVSLAKSGFGAFFSSLIGH